MTINASRGPCTPETRTVILNGLEEWRRSGKQAIFWLNGMAGTGKTTIAYSASQLWDKSNHLGASFFCSRGVPDCRNMILILTTVAVELSVRYPVFGEALEEVLSKDEGIQHRNLEVQLRKLIIDPWNTSKPELPEDLVIVIDALDECENNHPEFIQTLLDNASDLPFQILITSRPEYEIRTAIMAEDSSTRDICILHEVEKDLVQADIAKYLEHELRRSPYATQDIVNSIAELSDSLFIYASTLAKLILTRKVNILKCLEVLKLSSSNRDKLNLMATLDNLYREVLTRVVTDTPLEDGAQEIKEVLYTVICAREPMTQRALAEMWNLDQTELVRRLDLLRSVLFISEHKEDLPITTFHASFPDFLLDESRSKEFFCRPQYFNSIILDRCLGLMNSKLHQNMCNVKDRPSNSLVDIREVKALGPGVQYASTHWAEHFALSGYVEQQDSLNLIAEFLAEHSLHWFEYLSFQQQLASSLHSLESLESKISKDTKVGALVYEYLRFIQQMYDPIEYSAMEVYSSALIWIPQDSVLRIHHATLLKNTPHALGGLPQSWSGPGRVISIHSDYILSIATSQDGIRLISGSSDETVRVWNLEKQIEECVFTGHTNVVHSVAVCKDQNIVVSGSGDESICVWDIAKCEPVLTISTSSWVRAVAISPDTNWIASGNFDNAIYLWDRVNGRLIRSLQGHEGSVQSLTFMANGTTLVSGSSDNTVRVWNVPTGQVDSILRGHTGSVESVACSPVEDVIVTGSYDNTARLWAISGTELQALEGHSSTVICVAFMPDGRRVVTGSFDSTVRIWDVSLGESLYVLTAPGTIWSIGVFMDGTEIAASFGKEVGIWNVKGVKMGERAEEPGHRSFPADKVAGMAFSPDGRRVLLLPMLRILDTATLEEWDTILPHDGNYRQGALHASGRLVAASIDDAHVISVWNLEEDGTVASHHTLTGHTSDLTSLSFSHDEHRIVSASYDKTARVWDVTTGQQIHSLRHHRPVHHAVFSHNGNRIATTVKLTVHVWDSHSGQQLHQWRIDASYVTFTPDDRHFITSDKNQLTSYDHIHILNTRTLKLDYELKGYKCWTILSDGSSYALNHDGWIYHFVSFDAQPRRVLWVPSPYRPTLEVPPFTFLSPETRICLSRTDGRIILTIPRDY